MNITELARILKITPQELRNYLPLLGFHIGRKAIKINKSEANKIIKDWPNLRRKIEMDAQEKIKEEEKKKKELITSEKEEKHKLLSRPPVIVVMGHVDHGKTRLLDSIRKSHVIEGEAGGITQHIGAYQTVRNGQVLTFIDTPGHEAFTAMRSRGAKIADVAILVVAADDGVKPQTTETESENIKANPDASAAGTIIESNIDKGAGPVATILIQNGTLRVGDQLVLNNIIVGKINRIIKSDVLGSAEAIEESLEKINTKNVQVKVIKKGLGNITDGDIKRAEASGGQILGFNVKIPSVIEEIARDKNIKISIYSVIYDLINDIRKEMEAALDPTIQRKDLGRLKVRAIFRTEKNCQILGGIVLDDKIESDSLIEVVRNKEIIDRGKLLKLQSGKQDVNIVEANNECGIQYEGKPIIEEGDILQFYKEEKIINKL